MILGVQSMPEPAMAATADPTGTASSRGGARNRDAVAVRQERPEEFPGGKLDEGEEADDADASVSKAGSRLSSKKSGRPN